MVVLVGGFALVEGCCEAIIKSCIAGVRCDCERIPDHGAVHRSRVTHVLSYQFPRSSNRVWIVCISENLQQAGSQRLVLVRVALGGFPTDSPRSRSELVTYKLIELCS